MDAEVLELSAAAPLAHALAADIARRRGIRALSIKGPVAEHHGLRAPRMSADADVLVEPARFAEFCDDLAGLGWRTRVGRDTPSLLPQHSATYIHPDWPCDIDVHWMFPGFFADAEVVFEALWRSRSTLTIASTRVSAPSRPGTAVVMALHAVRDLRAERHRSERLLVLTALTDSFTENERDEFIGIVRVGGAGWALKDLLAQAGLPGVDDDGDEARRLGWDIFRSNVDDASSVAWWRQIGAARWWEKPAWLWRAVWVPRRDVPRNDVDSLPSHREAWEYRVRRWARGWRATMRHLRGNGKGQTR
ncbi:nucleotidyltransferase family protein [Microbacterium sp. NPDC057659]|uniref:nucleotidyltransferase family protein n=1 Tax=Microbacterium sp. NPDC057659 TaxID=3346198 RepID=UPI00366CAEDA